MVANICYPIFFEKIVKTIWLQLFTVQNILHIFADFKNNFKQFKKENR